MSSHGEKTEEPTPKRLKKAREEGSVAKSNDLSSLLALLGGSLILFSLGWRNLAELAAGTLSGSHNSEFSLMTALRPGIRLLLITLLPLTILMLLTGFIQTGGMVAFRVIKPKLERLNPAKRLRQIFSKKNLFEFIKTVMKLIFILLILVLVLNSIMKSSHYFLRFDTNILPMIYRQGALSLLKSILPVLVIVGLIDIIYQRFSLKKELMMTRQEVKEEFKEDEGNPEIKGRRKQLHQEIAMHNLREEVKRADVIIVNPSHIAIGLRYNENEDSAPLVVAKGTDHIAKEIIRIARENHIPVMRNLPLAHALFRIETGDEIPEELYKAVAEIFLHLDKKKR